MGTHHRIGLHSVGNVYMPVHGKGSVVVFDSNSKSLAKWGFYEKGDCCIKFLVDIAIEPRANVYAVDSWKL